MRDGKAVKYETMAAQKMVLDVHPSVRHLLGDPAVPLFVTEGVKKGDALVSQGACAVALLGVWNWRGTNEAGGKVALADWESIALNGRQCVVVFDSDVMVKAGVHAALERLKAFLESKGANTLLAYLPSGPHGEKQGVDDFLASGHTLQDVLACGRPDLLPIASPEEEDDEREEGGSVTSVLIGIGRSAELFRDDKRAAFVAALVENHRETWAVKSGDFRRWLVGSFFRRTGKAPSASAVADAIAVLEAEAQFAGDHRQVRVRTAQGEDGCIYLDIGDDSWSAIRIGLDGWTVVDVPPVHFIRGQAVAALPRPEPGGSIDELKQVINFGSEENLKRVVGWMLGALRPRGPYPILAFMAEHGTGKSAAARFLRALVDPSSVPLRGMPREERDLMIAARANQVLALDNVSYLEHWLSDALCRMATGGGWATRRLFTDAEEELFTQSRPLLINGIDDYISNADLLDRSMLISLPVIPPELRRQESELEKHFDRIKGRVLGALLDGVSAALKNLPRVKLHGFPRMADFAAWVAAAEPAFGWSPGSFLEASTAGATEAQDVVLEASVIGEPLKAFIMDEGEWTGTAVELLAQLADRVSDEVKRNRFWPRTAKGLSSGIRRLAPTLRSLGFTVEFAREATAARRRLIILGVQVPQATVQTVQTVQPAGRSPSALDALDGMDGPVQDPAEHARVDQRLNLSRRDPPGPTDGDRARLMAIAGQTGFPRLILTPGVSVPDGEEAWTKFVQRASPENFRAAVERLEEERDVKV
jgi:hypothetical protein